MFLREKWQDGIAEEVFWILTQDVQCCVDRQRETQSVHVFIVHVKYVKTPVWFRAACTKLIRDSVRKGNWHHTTNGKI